MRALKEYRYYVVAAAAVGAVVFFFAHSYLIVPLVTIEKRHIVVNQKVLSDYYNVHGAEALIEYVSNRTSRFTQQQVHSTGHALGEVLYRHEGIDAIADCGTSFDWGCLHQVIGQAFDEHGPNTLSILKERCSTYKGARDKGNCEHGIGHGIAYRDGYDEAKLNDGLRLCDTVSPSRPVPLNDGCHAGLLMEYNMHFMTMEYEGENGRPATTTNAFGLCTGVSDPAHKDVCVWWVQPWLHGNLYAYEHTPIVFSNLGALCDQITTGAQRETCFKGIGRSAGVNGRNPARLVISLCRAATSEKRMQELCLGYASRLNAGTGNPIGAQQICQIAESEFELTCRR